MTTTTDSSAINLEAIKKLCRSPAAWRAVLPNHVDALIAAVEALRDDLADLEALRAEDHAAIRQTILEKEAAEVRVAELARALRKLIKEYRTERDDLYDGMTNSYGEYDTPDNERCVEEMDAMLDAAEAALPATSDSQHSIHKDD